MSETLRRAPYPADTNFGHKRFEIDIEKLKASEFDKIASSDAWRAGVNLWMASWKQIPTGSLPDDDEELCILAGFRTDMRAWRSVRANALWKWQRVTDGVTPKKLYHPFLTAIVLRLISDRKTNVDRTKRARAAYSEKLESLGKQPKKRVTKVATTVVTPKLSDEKSLSTDQNTPDNLSVTSLHEAIPSTELSTGAYKSTRVPAPASESLKEDKIHEKSSSIPLPLQNADWRKARTDLIALFNEAIGKTFGPEQVRPWPHPNDFDVAGKILALNLDNDHVEFIFESICQRAKALGKRPPALLSYALPALEEAARAALVKSPRMAHDNHIPAEPAVPDADMIELENQKPRSPTGKLIVLYAKRRMRTEFDALLKRQADDIAEHSDGAETRKMAEQRLDELDPGWKS